MRLSVVSLRFLACVAYVNAQYFSAGWKPGQPVSETEEASAPTFVPQKTEHVAPLSGSLSSLFDLNKIITSEPVASLFARAGINITEKLAGVLSKPKLWDERVDLITDDNFHELIVNEPLTEQEEKDRTWIIVITVTAAKQDGISKFMDEVFDSAFNQTYIAGDLPDVRWGRIDYMNVTAITTKWAVWQAPYLVILRNRGKTLRFYKPHQLRLKEDALRDFLKHEYWKYTAPWSSSYAPGGSREYIMNYFAIGLAKIYNLVIKVPRWLMFIISGSIASIVINFLHRGPPAPAPQRIRPQTVADATTTQPQSQPRPTAESSSKRGGAKQRKGRK